VKLGKGAASVRLRLDGYEFSGSPRKDKSNRDFDVNWLYVVGDVHSEAGDWTFRGACLVTYEVLTISSWLRGVADGHVGTEDPAEPEPSLRFTEPGIAFGLVSCDADSATIRIYLSLEAQSPVFTEQAEFFVWDPESSVIVGVSFEELIEAAAEWDSAATAFPER
jgi:hypothetical protein